MATRYIRAGGGFASVGTSRYLMIATNVATQIVMLSGSQTLRIFNNGSGFLLWGDSNIAVNSANYIFPLGAYSWPDDGNVTLADEWSTYVRADSVQTLITVTDFR